MDASLRLTFFCGSCLGLAVGFAAGHVSVWQRIDHSRSTGISFNDLTAGHSASLGVGGIDFPVLIPGPEVAETVRIPVPGGAVVLNDPDLGDEPVHADALVEVPAAVNDVTLTTRDPLSRPTPPNTLPASPSKPLAHPATTAIRSELSKTQQAQAVSSALPELDPEVVQMLKDELEGVSEQQREIWADALRGMNPADAMGIITMWKKFGQNGTGPQHLSSPPPLFDASHPDDAPTPLGHPGTLRSLLPVPTLEEDLGTRIVQHNQANRETCGYLEMIPIRKEVAFDQAANSPHVEVVGYRLKIEPGRLIQTGNPSHVAVQRNGFFAVKLPTGEEQYTRVGRLVLDAERRLCIDLGDRDLPITPEVKLPERATRFMVQSGQLRIEVDGQSEPATVGPLQVAEFFDASRLQPLGGSLYSASTASGQPKMVAAELIVQTLEYPAIDNRSTTAGAKHHIGTPVAEANRE